MNRLMTIIGRHADNGTVFDLSELFFRFTLCGFLLPLSLIAY